MGRTNAAAEIHSPLYSSGTQTPVVMRHCGRFGTVSKTVDGGNVVREFESLPLRLSGGRERAGGDSYAAAHCYDGAVIERGATATSGREATPPARPDPCRASAVRRRRDDGC
jgi:hypothetical protein